MIFGNRLRNYLLSVVLQISDLASGKNPLETRMYQHAGCDLYDNGRMRPYQSFVVRRSRDKFHPL